MSTKASLTLVPLPTGCWVCGGPLPPKPATGRPPGYCSEGCRRDAEFTLRWITRRLEKLEDRASDARLEIATSVTEGQQAIYERELEAVEQEVALQKQRLRALIDDDQPSTT